MLQILRDLAPILEKLAEEQAGRKAEVAKFRRLNKKYLNWRKKRLKMVKTARRRSRPRYNRRHYHST